MGAKHLAVQDYVICDKVQNLLRLRAKKQRENNRTKTEVLRVTEAIFDAKFEGMLPREVLDMMSRGKNGSNRAVMTSPCAADTAR